MSKQVIYQRSTMVKNRSVVVFVKQICLTIQSRFLNESKLCVNACLILLSVQTV